MKTKLLSFTLILALLISCVACGGKQETLVSQNDVQTATSTPAVSTQDTDSEKEVVQVSTDPVRVDLVTEFPDGTVVSNVPIYVDTEKINMFNEMVTMAFEVSVSAESESPYLELFNGRDIVYDTLDLSSYSGQDKTVKKTFYQYDIGNIIKNRVFAVRGDGCTLHSITVYGYQKTDYVDPRDGEKPLEIVQDFSNSEEGVSSPIAINTDKFEMFDGPVTLTVDMDVIGSEDWLALELTCDPSLNISENYSELYAIDLSDYLGQRLELRESLTEDTVKEIIKTGQLIICGDGFRVYKVTITGYKDKNYYDPYEGMEELEIVLDYPAGMYIGDYDFSLTLNVDQFDKFYGPITMLFDMDVATEAEWFSLDFMTTWEGSGFYDDYSDSTINLYDYRGQHRVITKILRLEDIERCKKDGILGIVGNGYSLNSITLKGYKNENYKAPVAPADSPVAMHGQLSIKDGGFVDQNGEPYRLLGAAIGWDTLCPQLINVDTYSYLRDEWGMNAIRCGMEAHSDNNKNGFMDPYVNWDYWLYYMDHKIDTVIAAGLYVVLDYHNYQNPLDTLSGAERFFEHVAEKYAGCPNIIYEIGNEPNFGEWKHTKQYANKLIPLIRSYSPDAVIVCPSDGWAQKFIDAYNDPLDFDNVIYTFHLYCNEFYEETYNELKMVLEDNFPIFMTEFNICGANNEPNNFEAGDKWNALLDRFGVSYLYHNIMINYDNFDYSEVIGLLPHVSELSGWTEDDMGASMQYFYHEIRRDSGLE